jgi:hypothetical protein
MTNCVMSNSKYPGALHLQICFNIVSYKYFGALHLTSKTKHVLIKILIYLVLALKITDLRKQKVRSTNYICRTNEFP